MSIIREKVELRVGMATLAYALTALAHLEADDYENMGMMDNELPGVTRTDEPSSVENYQASAWAGQSHISFGDNPSFPRSREPRT